MKNKVKSVKKTSRKASTFKCIEKSIKKRRVFTGKVISVNADEVVLPNKVKSIREYIEHPGAVAILPFIDEERIVLVEQYRYPVAEATYEVPAGKLDAKEDVISCVNRELMEETGYFPVTLRKLVSFWPTPAFSNEIIHIYEARNLKEKKLACDEDELIRTVIMPVSKAFEMIKTGKIKDSKTIIALLAYRAGL